MNAPASEQVLKTADYKKLIELLSGDNYSTRGITNWEVQHLSWLAAHMAERVVIDEPIRIVEIGSHRGKSTCSLASGLRHAAAKDAIVIAVDLWTLGTTTFAHYRSKETWDIFNMQVKSLGLDNYIRPFMSSSENAAAKFRAENLAIDVLFIDGGHKYDAVHADYELWKGMMKPGSHIAFHDYGTRFDGVDQTIKEAFAEGIWRDPQVVGRIWSAERAYNPTKA